MRSAIIRHILYYFITIIFWCSVVSVIAKGQSNPYSNGFTPTGLESGTANSFPLSGFDHINPATGSLNVSLPFLQIGGRGGAGYTMSLVVETHWFLEIWPSTDPSRENDWITTIKIPSYNLGPGKIKLIRSKETLISDCNNILPKSKTLKRFIFTWPNGSETIFVDAIFNGAPQTNYNCSDQFSRGNIWRSIDGTGMTFISDQPIMEGHLEGLNTISGNMMSKDGTIYRINDKGLIEYIRERNGNKSIFQYDIHRNILSYARDSIGREIFINTIFPSTYSLRPSQTVISYKGVSGEARTIIIDWAYYLPSSEWLRPGLPGPYNHWTAFPYYGINRPNSNENDIKPYGPSKITFSDGSDKKSYRFWYNAYSEIARIDLPIGGRFEYDWRGGYGTDSTGSQGAPIGPYRVVKERRVYSSTTSTLPIEQMLISRAGKDEPTIIQQVIPGTNPLVNIQLSKHYFTGDPSGITNASVNNLYPNPLDNKEFKIERFDGTTLRQTIEHHWENSGLTPQLRWEKTLLNDVNLVSLIEYEYDSYHNVISTREFDYGTGVPGPLIRRINTSFLTINPVQGNVDYAADLNIHIRNLPVQQIVYDVDGNQKAQTIYEYDNYSSFSGRAPLTDRPNISGLDSSYTTGYQTRGNVTSIARLLDTPSMYLTTFQQYDIAGNVVKAIDGRGNAGTIDYSDRFGSPDGEARANAGAAELGGQLSYAFPTKVTNALEHEAYTQYDYYLGRSVDSEDINGVTSSVYYNNPLDRPTQLIRAANIDSTKNQSYFSYNDADHLITASSDLNNYFDNVLHSKTRYDGLGRTIRSGTYEIENAKWLVVDTQYDSLGRPYKISNPYRLSSMDEETPSTAQWTTTSYDSLGRVVKIETPDGAIIATEYIGNQVTVTDQEGKKRRSEMDALGRLTKVTEDPDGFNYHTVYSYDVLNNLRQVTQGSQTRTFVYDSLSRLISATNPENGTITYTYDPNGNLLTKTDGRNITTTYTYDVLNRNKTVNYSDTSLNPDNTFYYDNSTAGKYGKGRFWFSYSNGDFSNGSNSEARAIDGYDAMGRPLSERRHFKLNGVWLPGVDASTGFIVSRTYDRAGNVKTQTYPSGRTVNYVYDSVSRLNSFSGNLGGISANYATDIRYNARSQVISEQFGANIPLYLRQHYNKRGQLFDIRLGTSNDSNLNNEDPNVWQYANGSWNRGAIRLFLSANYNDYDSVNPNQPDNNGNIHRMDHFAPKALDANGNITSWVMSIDNYQYDQLNRLTRVQETSQNIVGTDFTQAFSYDQWGNRTIDVGATTAGIPGLTRKTFAVNTSNNHITSIDGVSVNYDAAGNQTNDGTGVRVYDSQNRMTQVVQSGISHNYTYDNDGRRTRRSLNNGAQNIWQIYGIDGELVAEYGQGGGTSSPQKEYGYRNGNLVVIWDGSQSGDKALKWLMTDHLGSTRMEIDKSGSLAGITRHDYLPFGEELNADSGAQRSGVGFEPPSSNTKQRFTSKERDIETGLDYFGARYYGCAQGRFTSIDPIGLAKERLIDPQRINLYAYTANNPLKFVDPDGEDICVTGDDKKNCLFTLDDGKKAISSQTAKELYKNKIQWFEPEADNYMPLKSVASNLTSNQGLKHFTWDQIAAFATTDRYMISYRSGGAGDWKASKQGADGYLLVTVGGQPYWADAIGQLPFAVNQAKGVMTSQGSDDLAIKSTLLVGQSHGGGQLFGGTPDKSNRYDNYMILRGAIWATNAYDISPWKGKYSGATFYSINRNNYSTIRLSDPINKGTAVKHGIKK